jgi:hypothetical protein
MARWTSGHIRCLAAISAHCMPGRGVAGTKAMTGASDRGVAAGGWFAEAGDCGRGLMGVEVARWPFPAQWPPAENEGEEDGVAVELAVWPGGLDNVSATMLAAPAMWRMSLVYSAT